MLNKKIHQPTDFPRCILHLDGDGFFASCQQVMRAELQGKPVVTGRERGVITSASVEAKKLGIKRGVTPWDAKKICPSLIFIDSDYESYELFSLRMYHILKTYTHEVEHYSIDECFADITGLDKVYGLSYSALAEKIKGEIQAALGLTFSVGISLNKTLSKVASRWKKPNGFTAISKNQIKDYLGQTKLEKIWGIGTQTNAKLNNFGLITALDFAQVPENIIHNNFDKQIYIIWRELNGYQAIPLSYENLDAAKSLSKTHTFSHPTTDINLIEQELLLNLERAFWQLRQNNMRCQSITVMVKTQSFKYSQLEIVYPRPTAYESEVTTLILAALKRLIRPGVQYRATGIFLRNLQPDNQIQTQLFEPLNTLERLESLYQSLDRLRRHYHRPVVRTGRLKLPVRDRQTYDLLKPGLLLPVAPAKKSKYRIKFL